MLNQIIFAVNSINVLSACSIHTQFFSQGEDLSALHSIGTAAVVVQVTGTNWPKPAYTLLVTGLCRFKLQELLQETPFPVATVTQLDKLPEDIGTLSS